ncbi:MAG: M20 family metallopeptidase [Rikenellaceae bacterium]
MKTVTEKAEEIYEYIKGIRETIHANPELSFQEFKTQALICSELEKQGIEYKKIANTGVLARIDGRGIKTDEAVVLRADMDALEICEQTNVSFASKNGAMHGCGHDIHTSCLLGALCILNSMKDEFEGSVYGLFQPGEEKNPGGASIVLKEGHLDQFKPTVVIGQHVSPELKLGTYGIRPGQYMAATDEIRITVEGKGGHGAMPHTTKDPIVATSAIIMALQTVVSRSANPIYPTLLTIGKINSNGGGTNIIPQSVSLEGTLRTMNESERAAAKERICEIVEGVAKGYGCVGTTNVSHGFPSVINNEKMTRITEDVLKGIVSDENVIKIDMRMTGEDFGFYTQRYPSVFYRIGVGHLDEKDASNLHSTTFYPAERGIYYGMTALASLALKFSKK